jgi:integrase
MASLFKRSNGNYYICYEEDGKRKWKSTGQTHKSDALKELIQFEIHLKTHRSKSTLRQFKEEVLSHSQTSLAPKTLEMYSAAFNHMLAIVGDKYVSSFTPRDADLYRTTRAKIVSPVSVNIELRTIRACFSLAQRWKLISENPFKKITLLKIPDQQPVCIRKEDFGKLLSAIEESWFRDLVTFAVLTGLRGREILNLKWKDVDLERRLIHIYSSILKKIHISCSHFPLLRFHCFPGKPLGMNHQVILIMS